MAKLRTSTGWLVRETIKGLPEAAKTVGKAMLKPIKAAGRTLLTPLRKQQEYKAKQDTAKMNQDRTKAIKSAIKAGDYMYQLGDEKLVPEAGKYKK